MKLIFKVHQAKLFVGALIVLFSGTALRAQSAYFQAITNLNPVAYWPLQETAQPATADVETNLGSLGDVGDAFYESTSVQRGFGSAIVSDPDPAIALNGTNGSWLAVPRLDPGLNVAKASGTTNGFTVECWMKPFVVTKVPSAVISQTAYSYGFDGSTNVNGWVLSVGDGNATQLEGAFFTGSGTNSVVAKKSSGSYPALANLVSNWWYVVIEFTGVTNAANNAHIYINGAANSTAATLVNFSPDFYTPLEIGSMALNGNNKTNRFNGAIDEVAIYTNALTTLQINAHYTAGTNVSPATSYAQTVLSDHPYLYYRMNAPVYTAPNASSFSIATNYGSLGAAMNAAYEPGTKPGLAGPTNNPGLDANAVGINGLNSCVDAGFNGLLNPTGHQPFTVTAWFQLNPGDGNRTETIAGHGGLSWGLSTSNGAAFFSLEGTSVGIAATNINTNGGANDGYWHMISGIYDGSNYVVELDLRTNGVISNNSIAGTNLDVLIGGAPDNVSVGNDGQFNEQYFPGRIAQVAFFTNALTVAQLQQLYFSAGSALQISQQPVSATVNVGTAFTNTVTAAGTPPLSYQWYKDDAPLAGQTNINLILNPTQVSDTSTNYYAIVSNSSGSVTSSVVSLMVLSFPIITQDVALTNVTLYAGGGATFSIGAVGSDPLAFQWYSNSVAIATATNASYKLANAGPANTVQTYYCLVMNSYGTAPSSTGTVTVIPFPTASYPAAIIEDSPIGYWRMDEGPDSYPNNGIVARDYWGGNNGIYTNTDLAQSGHLANEIDKTSALFGYNVFSDSDVIGIPTNVDFAAPTNHGVAFSIEAWAQGYPQTLAAGIVGKGASGAEQFSLDTATTNFYGFGVRDASGVYHRVDSGVSPADRQWHHLLGVCNEPHGMVNFYIDGQLVGAATINTNAGILAAPKPMLIGSKNRSVTAPTAALQFVGNIADVAVYDYALTSNQVAAHYDSATVSAKIITQPTNETANESGSVIFSSVVAGTPPLTNQWYNAGTGLPVPGATNTTLVLTNLQISDNNSSYYMVTANAYGSDQSPNVTLTISFGPPQLQKDVPLKFYTFPGGTVSVSVSEAGTEPLTNQWQFNGTTLADNSRITGSQSNVLTISKVQASDAGLYQIFVTNSDGSTKSSVATLVIINAQPIGFYDTGMDWTTNIGGHAPAGPVFNNNILTALDGFAGSENRTFFFNEPQFIGAFRSMFTYQDVGGVTANGYGGVVFSVQGDPRGSSALGSGSTGLAVSGITPSVDVALSIDSTIGIGYKIVGYGVPGLSTLGGGSYLPPGSIDITSGHPINIGVSFAIKQLTLTMTDAVTQVSFGTNITVGALATVFGTNTAHVGFTAGGSSANDTQLISNFSFVSPAGIIIQPTNIVSDPGAAVTLFATVAGESPLTNQWYDAGTGLPVMGATNTTLVLTNVQVGASYYLLTANAFGSEQSTNATLTINPPAETVFITATNTIIIGWPETYSDYTLQQNSDLATTNWVNITNAVNVVGGQNQVFLPMTRTNMFYRLKH